MAQASFGTYTVLQGWSTTVGEDGLQAFNSALHLDPTFALAYSGRGCIRFGDGEFEEAAADFRKAAELLPSLTLAPINESLAFAYASQLATLASLDSKPGMSLAARFGQADKMVESKAGAIRAAKPDEIFWGIIPKFSELPQAEQRVFIQKHGVDTVKQALQVYVYEKGAEARRANAEVQKRQDSMTVLTPLAHRLAEADWILGAVGKVIPGQWASWKTVADISVKGYRLMTKSLTDDHLREMERLNLQAARAAAEVRRIHGLPSVDELAKPSAPIQVNRPSSVVSMHNTYSIPLSSPSARPSGVSTKEIARAYLNKGN